MTARRKCFGVGLIQNRPPLLVDERASRPKALFSMESFWARNAVIVRKSARHAADELVVFAIRSIAFPDVTYFGQKFETKGTESSMQLCIAAYRSLPAWDSSHPLPLSLMTIRPKCVESQSTIAGKSRDSSGC